MSAERNRAKTIEDYGVTVAASRPVEDEPTRLYRPGHAASPGEIGHGREVAEDLPAGWLVVLDGPGKGNIAVLGYGVNSIGRDPTERVPLDYGDAMISRTRHIVVTYDPRGRKFYVQHGSGANLSYLNDEPILAPTELERTPTFASGIRRYGSFRCAVRTSAGTIDLGLPRAVR